MPCDAHDIDATGDSLASNVVAKPAMTSRSDGRHRTLVAVPRHVLGYTQRTHSQMRRCD